MASVPPWYLSRRFRQIASSLLIAFAVVEAVVAIALKYNDIGGHISRGE